MSEKFIILVIEDNQDDISSIQSTFNQLRLREIESALTFARSIAEAKTLLEGTDSFDLIITDLCIPDCRGLDCIRAIQEVAPDIPILAISHTTDEAMIRQIIRLGAQDYLPKNELDPAHLQRLIYNCIERNRLKQSLKALSFTDEMTGAYNRRGFYTLLEQQYSHAKRSGQGFYLFIIDLDYLKSINDIYGHPIGDHAIMDAADCLHLAFRHYDIIGRIGGDEFAVIAINAAKESLKQLKQNILYQVEELNRINTEPYQLSLSIGSTYFDGQADNKIEDLIHKADQDLYNMKRMIHKLGGPSGE